METQLIGDLQVTDMTLIYVLIETSFTQSLSFFFLTIIIIDTVNVLMTRSLLFEKHYNYNVITSHLMETTVLKKVQ